MVNILADESFTCSFVDGLVVPMQTLPELFQMPEPGKLVEPVNVFVPEKVLLSERSVEEANVHVEVATLESTPLPFAYTRPLVMLGKVTVPAV